MRSFLLSGVAAALLAVSSISPAQSAGVCDCCSGSVEELCKSACEAANTGGGVCRPAAWFGDANAIGGKTPLNGFSYQGLKLSSASRQELEVIRKWVESQRKKAERKASRTFRAYRRGRASAEAFKASEATRDEAVVNYQHAMQAYLAAVRGE